MTDKDAKGDYKYLQVHKGTEVDIADFTVTFVIHDKHRYLKVPKSVKTVVRKKPRDNPPMEA